MKSLTSKLHGVLKSINYRKPSGCVGYDMGPDQVGMWWFTFITCQSNKGLRGEVEKWAKTERAEFWLPLTAEAVWCKNISLCEPRRQGEMCSVGEHIDAGLLKIMFSESAWSSFVHDAAGLCRMPLPASLNFIFSLFALRTCVCTAFQCSCFIGMSEWLVRLEAHLEKVGAFTTNLGN